MRRLILPALCVAALLLTGCGNAGTPDAGAGLDAPADTTGAGEAADAPRPACPFTAAQASELVGLPLVDEGNCLFGDGKGVASLTVTTASRIAGEATYDYQRRQAEQSYQRVTDVSQGGKGYLAVKDIEGQAVLIADSGAFTLTMSSFQRTPDGYEESLRRLLDALPR